MKNALIIDDDKDFRLLIKRQLLQEGFNCFDCGTSQQALAILLAEPVDIVICDLNLKKENGKDIVIELKLQFPHLPVIVMTGYSNVRSAVDLMRSGATDYLIKPMAASALAVVLRKRLLASVAVCAVKVEPPREKNGAAYIFSPGPFTNTILHDISLVAPTDYSVIIYGESGSGKEAYARELHKQSKRSMGPFVAIDCGALPKALSSSILFGHEKGAFTGALNRHEGVFELADGGTIFLDEIANLPYETQVSLLRGLQERKIRRVGGTTDIPVNVRIIVASNKKLWDECRLKRFREDLFHRLNEFTIDIAPLRDRKSDIEFYATYFLEQTTKELRKPLKAFTPELMASLAQYKWPGNLRELRNVVRRMVLLSESSTLGIDLLPSELTLPAAEHFQSH